MCQPVPFDFTLEIWQTLAKLYPKKQLHLSVHESFVVCCIKLVELAVLLVGCLLLRFTFKTSFPSSWLNFHWLNYTWNFALILLLTMSLYDTDCAITIVQPAALVRFALTEIGNIKWDRAWKYIKYMSRIRSSSVTKGYFYYDS